MNFKHIRKPGNILLFSLLTGGAIYYISQSETEDELLWHSQEEKIDYSYQTIRINYTTTNPEELKELQQLIKAGIDVNKEDYYGNTPLIKAVEEGNAEIVKLLLAAPGIDVNITDKEGNTPLRQAAFFGHAECVKLLLAAPGIDVNQAFQDDFTPLSWAAFLGHAECVKLLLAAPGIDVNQAFQDGFTPLLWAAGNGQAECVKLLLAAPGINVNQASQDGLTPLLWAADNGQAECVKLLLAAPGIDVSSWNPISFAVLQNDNNNITKLIKAGVDVNQADKNGNTPLLWAVKNRKDECLKLLLAAPGINVNQADKEGNTPLLLAVKNDETECLKLLLAAPGIDVNQASQDGLPPLLLAASNGQAECVKLLLAAPGIEVNQADKEGNTPLLWAVKNRNDECIKLLLAAPGIDVNQADKEGNTPLHFAARRHLDGKYLKLLLAAPDIDVVKKNEKGISGLDLIKRFHRKMYPMANAKAELQSMGIKNYNEAIHSACDNPEKLRLLIEAGADINSADKDGNTPLIMAAYHGNTQCVKRLLMVPGIDVDKTNKNKETALQIAQNRGHSKCAEIIRKKSSLPAKLEAQEKLRAMGITNYDEAILKAYNNPEKLRLLIAAGADISELDVVCDILYLAAKKGNAKCVKILLEVAGVRLNNLGFCGKNPLSVAESDSECAFLLRIVDPEARNHDAVDWTGRRIRVHKELYTHDDLVAEKPSEKTNNIAYLYEKLHQGETPLHLAAMKGQSNQVRFILSTPGIDVNKQDVYGQTALHWAAFSGNVECVKLLLAAPGINVNIRDDETITRGKTPLYKAQYWGHTECAKLIRKAGGIK